MMMRKGLIYAIILISSVFSEDQRLIHDVGEELDEAEGHLFQDEEPLSIEESANKDDSHEVKDSNSQDHMSLKIEEDDRVDLKAGLQKQPEARPSINDPAAATQMGQFLAGLIRQLDPNLHSIRSMVNSVMPALQKQSLPPLLPQQPNSQG